MKIRLAKKILKIWCRAVDKRYYEPDYIIKECKAFNRFAHLYRKATFRWNKANAPQSNVSIIEAITRNKRVK